jgi:hypothetical protein
MAIDLGIKRCWFEKDHYDIPKRRVKEIAEKAKLVRPREILMIIKNAQNNI